MKETYPVVLVSTSSRYPATDFIRGALRQDVNDVRWAHCDDHSGLHRVLQGKLDNKIVYYIWGRPNPFNERDQYALDLVRDMGLPLIVVTDWSPGRN